LEALKRRLRRDVLANPPLGYDPGVAADAVWAQAEAEVAASQAADEAGAFDAAVTVDPEVCKG
jgi:hypothetical protein